LGRGTAGRAISLLVTSIATEHTRFTKLASGTSRTIRSGCTGSTVCSLLDALVVLELSTSQTIHSGGRGFIAIVTFDSATFVDALVRALVGGLTIVRNLHTLGGSAELASIHVVGHTGQSSSLRPVTSITSHGPGFANLGRIDKSAIADQNSITVVVLLGARAGAPRKAGTTGLARAGSGGRIGGVTEGTGKALDLAEVTNGQRSQHVGSGSLGCANTLLRRALNVRRPFTSACRIGNAGRTGMLVPSLAILSASITKGASRIAGLEKALSSTVTANLLTGRNDIPLSVGLTGGGRLWGGEVTKLAIDYISGLVHTVWVRTEIWVRKAAASTKPKPFTC